MERDLSPLEWLALLTEAMGRVATDTIQYECRCASWRGLPPPRRSYGGMAGARDRLYDGLSALAALARSAAESLGESEWGKPKEDRRPRGASHD